MKTITKRNGRAMSMPAGLAYGAAVSVMLLLLFCGLIAKMILTDVIADKDIGYSVLLLLLLSSFLGALTAYRKIKAEDAGLCVVRDYIFDNPAEYNSVVFWRSV